MKVEIPHEFEAQEAADRVRALTDYWGAKYGVKTSWNGTSATVDGKAKGIKFSGSFAIDGDRLRGEFKVGFLAEKLGGRGYVEGKLQEYFDPKKTLEQLRSRIP